MSNQENGKQTALAKRQEASKNEIATFRSTGDKTLDFLATLESRTRIANAIAQAGFTPFKKPEQVLAVMLMGHELGLAGPMAAANNLFPVPVKGGGQKLGMYASLMWGLAERAVGATYREEYLHENGCKLFGTRPDWDHEVSAEFTVEDAKRAGLLSKDGYKNYPKDLYFARALSRLARKIGPGVLSGIYSIEELSDGAVAGVEIGEAVEVEEGPTRTATVGDVLAQQAAALEDEPDFEIVADEGGPTEGVAEPAVEPEAGEKVAGEDEPPDEEAEDEPEDEEALAKLDLRVDELLDAAFPEFGGQDRRLWEKMNVSRTVLRADWDRKLYEKAISRLERYVKVLAQKEKEAVPA